MPQLPFWFTKLARRAMQLGFGTLLLILPASAQQMTLNNQDRILIRSVIERQLKAFEQDDAATAYTFASSGIREKFGSPESFLEMVKTAYPAVYRPRSVMFESLGSVQGVPAQEVILLSPEGKLVKAIYLMEQQADGSWKIGGCFLVPVQGETI